MFESLHTITHDYFLPHQLPQSILKKKQTCFVVAIFLWNVFDPFQPNVPLMMKIVFPYLNHWLERHGGATTKVKKTIIIKAALHKLKK